MEKSLQGAPWQLASELPMPLRPLGKVLALVLGPTARIWAAALGSWLRRRGPVSPRHLRWLQPIWREVGRYAGFSS